MARSYDGKRLLEELKRWREKEEWLFALAAVKAGLEREGNLDEEADEELAAALAECGITFEELDGYVKKNRRKLLRFLDSSPPG